jgi:bifunctional non-homologous end joining protein LigD
MIKGLKKLHSGEPACRKRSDGDHLRFVIHKRNDAKINFTIELNGIKSWAVRGVPSMNPLEQRQAEESKPEVFSVDIQQTLKGETLLVWDNGNYIPIDDDGSILSEIEAIKCLHEGNLKFFVQGKKLVGQFVLIKKEKNTWLLIKRHDEFASYNYHKYELVEH